MASGSTAAGSHRKNGFGRHFVLGKAGLAKGESGRSHKKLPKNGNFRKASVTDHFLLDKNRDENYT